MTLLLPMSVVALLALAPAPVVAADVSPQPGEGREGGAAPPSPAPPSPLAGQSLDRLSATRERPLFSPTRRPPPLPPLVVAAPEPPPPPPDVVLFGIVMESDEAHAVVRTGPGGKVIRVRIGDDIGGWKVTQIEGRRLVLSRDDRIATFMMFAGNSANGAPRTGPEASAANAQPQSQTQSQNQMRQNAPAPSDQQSSGGRRPHRPR